MFYNEKHFVLNNFLKSPFRKKVTTKGVFFELVNVNVDSGAWFSLAVTAGVIVEKEATGMHIKDLVIETPDYFICMLLRWINRNL